MARKRISSSEAAAKIARRLTRRGQVGMRRSSSKFTLYVTRGKQSTHSASGKSALKTHEKGYSMVPNRDVAFNSTN